MNAMKLRPLGSRVIVKPETTEEKTKGGIFLPETASKEKPQVGTVLAVGPGKILENGQKVALEVKVNDRIIFSKYAGTEIKINEVEYLILSENDILAISNE